MNTQLFELSTEIKGISAMLSTLQLALDSTENELTKKTIQDTLFGIAEHLDRISVDMENMQNME